MHHASGVDIFDFKQRVVVLLCHMVLDRSLASEYMSATSAR